MRINHFMSFANAYMFIYSRTIEFPITFLTFHKYLFIFVRIFFLPKLKKMKIKPRFYVENWYYFFFLLRKNRMSFWIELRIKFFARFLEKAGANFIHFSWKRLERFFFCADFLMTFQPGLIKSSIAKPTRN